MSKLIVSINNKIIYTYNESTLDAQFKGVKI